jgi:glycosyltransferase involved in cell wall biosynthesis
MTRAPEVSVLLPVYNGERFLAATVRSLLEQTFRDFEIVAVDDGSTDGSVQLLRTFSDPRIRIERNPRNLGLIETLNRGIELCRGEFIARMDADDVALPTRLEKQVTYLRQHPECVLVATNRETINDRDEPVSTFNRPATDGRLVRWKLLTGNFITHPTVMLRSNALPRPLFHERYRHAEDYAAWLELLSVGELEVLPEKLLKYRFHGQSVSHTHRLPQVRAAMAALADHLRAQYGAEFELESLALWSAAQDTATFAKPHDFFHLLRWMNPLRAPFRKRLAGAMLWRAFVHYHRRLVFLLISHRRRPELVLPVLGAIALSPLPRRR